MELSCALCPRNGWNGCIGYGGVFDRFPIANGIAKKCRVVQREESAVVSTDFSMNRNIADESFRTVPERFYDGQSEAFYGRSKDNARAILIGML